MPETVFLRESDPNGEGSHLGRKVNESLGVLKHVPQDRGGNGVIIVQIRYENRRYEIRFVVRAGVEHDSPDRYWRKLGQILSEECFRTSPVDVHLTDEKFKTLKVIHHAPIRPDLPIEVSFRPSIGGGSLVARYKNVSDKYLALSVTLRNPTHNQTRTIVLDIGPNQTKEHGWAEGWSYASGETLSLTHSDFETLDIKVP